MCQRFSCPFCQFRDYLKHLKRDASLYARVLSMLVCHIKLGLRPEKDVDNPVLYEVFMKT